MRKMVLLSVGRAISGVIRKGQENRLEPSRYGELHLSGTADSRLSGCPAGLKAHLIHTSVP